MSVSPTDINQLMRHGQEIDRAVREAVIEAVSDHKRAGQPIAVWRNDRVVWLAPEEIPERPDAES